MNKRYCVAERWVVEVRYYVEADSDKEACEATVDVWPNEQEYIDVIETIVEEVK